MGETTAKKPLTLQQKFVKLREAVPYIQQKQHSDGVKYKFAKISDIYELLTPAMNEHGVNFDITEEKPTRHDELGNAVYYHSYQQQTRNGPRTVWVYEADLTLQWTNADDPADTIDVKLHALGTNDGGPDKAKGSAWTYCLKYYLFEKFGIDQGDDDPDNNDLSGQTITQNNAQNGAGSTTYQGQQQSGKNGQSGAPRPLSDAQVNRMYTIGEKSGYTKESINDWLVKRYGAQDPRNLTREQYDEACTILERTPKE